MSKFSVKKPMTVFVAVILVLILGIVSFTKMKTDLLPSLDLPYAVVMTTYVGASPEEVEMIVTKPVEQSMATISNIKNVSSVSQENVSIVILEFATGTDMGVISIDIRESLDLLEAAWTDDFIGTPMVMKINPDMLPVMVAAVNVDGMDHTQVSEYLDNELLARIESIEGVASVSVSGRTESKLNVLLSQEKITQVGLQLSNKISEQFVDAQAQLDTAKKELETGRAELEKQKQELTAGFQDAEDAITAGKTELETKMKELVDNEAALKEQQESLFSNRLTIEEGLRALADNEAQLLEGEKNLADNRKQLDAAKTELEKGEAELTAYRSELELGIKEINENSMLDEAGKQAALAPLQQALTELVVKETQLAESKKLQQSHEDAYLAAKENVDKMRSEFDTSKAELTVANASVAEGLAQIEAGLTAITEGRTQLDAAMLTIQEQETAMQTQKTEATSGLGSAEEKLSAGEAEYNKGAAEFEAAKAAALKAADLGSILTTDMITGLLTAQNFSMPAGYITEEGYDYLIRVGDSIADLPELQNLVLFDTGIESFEPITLQDIADVFVSDNSAENYAKVNGSDALLLTMEKQTSYSTAEVSDAIHERFDDISKDNTAFHVSYLMDQGIYIDMVINSVMNNLIAGAILAILILIFFLKDIRPTVIIATSIPVSVIFALVLMYFSGVTLNIISLSGLAVGVGMLVDNSIVVIENIYRLRNKGYNRIQSAVLGARQVAAAITSSTLTTICVFLPIVFVEGLTRQLFVDMALTIAYSLIASLIIALTLVPAMSSGMLRKTKETKQPILGFVKRIYEKAINWSLSHRLITMAIVVVLLIVSIFASLSRGTSYMPEMDSPQLSVSVTMPKDATDEEVFAYLDDISSRIMTIDDIETVGVMVGGGMMLSLGSGGGSGTSVYIQLKEDKSESSFAVAEKINELCADMPCEVLASGSAMDMSALGGSGISLQIRGENIETLQKLSTDLAKQISAVEGILTTSDGQEDPAPEYKITVDKEKAISSGLTVAQVYAAIAGELKTATSATTIRYGSTDYPVFVTSTKEEEGFGLQDILNYEFSVTQKDGSTKTILLSDIASVKEQNGLTSIRRNSQQRYLTVSATLAEGYNIGLVSRDVDKVVADFTLPDGYTIQSSGENDTINDALVELVKMLLLAVAFIYLIMVAQFQSLLSPFIVMFTIPLAFTGGFFGLFLTGNEISVIAMIGFIMMSGIIVNNGIVLVDYINQLRLDGKSKREALVEAGLTRLRPILMTALTTILGLSTMAIGFGMGADMVQPVAIVTIGGLLYGTLTTLFVVPVMYDLLHKKEMKKVSDEDLNAIEEL